MSQRPPLSVRRALSAHEPGRGKVYPPHTRAQVIRYARGRRAEGADWKAVAGELGMRFETVRRWCERDAPAMRAVRVVTEVPTASSAHAVVVVSRSGHRIEGLTVEEAIAALRALE